MFLFVRILFIFLLYEKALGNMAPNYIRPCVDLSPECLKRTINEVLPEFVKGIPSLGAVPLDPFEIEIPDLELYQGLKISLINGRIYGLKTCLFKSAKLVVEKSVLDVEFHCNLVLKGKYKATGKLLVVKLDGDGDATIKGDNLIVKGQLKLADKVKKGVTHYSIKEYTVKHHFGKRVNYAVTNLFKGNPDLSKTVLAFINENWKIVSEEIGAPIVDIVIKSILQVVKKFLDSVPKEELFPSLV